MKVFWQSIACLILVSGCTNNVTPENVAKFSTALDGTSSAISDSYVIANDVDALRDRRERAVDYSLCHVPEINRSRDIITLCDPKKSNLFLISPSKPFLSPKLLKPRQDALKALQDYAEGLTALAGDQASKKAEAAFKESNDALIGLIGTIRKENDPKLNVIGDAISSFGGILVNLKVQRLLKQTVEDTHPRLELLVKSLSADLEFIKPAAVEDIEAANRQFQLVLADDQLEQLSQQERFDLYERYSSQVRSEDDVERAFDRVGGLLQQLLKSHAALANPESPDAIVEVTAFFNQAADLGEIIKKLEDEL